MYDTIRIALVSEGITDWVILRAAIESFLDGRSFILKLLQPEESAAFAPGGNAGLLGGGWKGVYKWCRQATLRSGRLRSDPLFVSYDLLIIHLDADVARQDPANEPIYPIPDLAGQLPCENPCPPPNATTDLLRQRVLDWVGETEVPVRTVLCTPSKNTEAWVMAAFFPNDREMIRKGWECHPEPEVRLAQQKLEQRFSKSKAAYEQRRLEFQAAWPSIVENLSEAARFQNDLAAVIELLPA